MPNVSAHVPQFTILRSNKERAHYDSHFFNFAVSFQLAASLCRNSSNGVPYLLYVMLRGEIIKSPAGHPATRTGDPRLRRMFDQGTLRKKIPKPNRTIWGILENTLSHRPATKSARPDCRTPGPGETSPVRAIDHRPAQSGSHFRGRSNVAPPENMHDY